MYRQISHIRRIQIPTLKFSSTRLSVVFAQSLEARCYVENEDVVGAAPTGDAPTTSEWSAILLPTKVRLILDVLRYINDNFGSANFSASTPLMYDIGILTMMIILQNTSLKFLYCRYIWTTIIYSAAFYTRYGFRQSHIAIVAFWPKKVYILQRRITHKSVKQRIK